MLRLGINPTIQVRARTARHHRERGPGSLSPCSRITRKSGRLSRCARPARAWRDYSAWLPSGFAVADRSSPHWVSKVARPPPGETCGVTSSLARARISRLRASAVSRVVRSSRSGCADGCRQHGQSLVSGRSAPGLPVLAKAAGPASRLPPTEAPWRHQDNGNETNRLFKCSFFHFSSPLSSGKDNETSVPTSPSGLSFRYTVWRFKDRWLTRQRVDLGLLQRRQRP